MRWSLSPPLLCQAGLHSRLHKGWEQDLGSGPCTSHPPHMTACSIVQMWGTGRGSNPHRPREKTCSPLQLFSEGHTVTVAGVLAVWAIKGFSAIKEAAFRYPFGWFSLGWSLHLLAPWRGEERSYLLVLQAPTRRKSNVSAHGLWTLWPFAAVRFLIGPTGKTVARWLGDQALTLGSSTHFHLV